MPEAHPFLEYLIKRASFSSILILWNKSKLCLNLESNRKENINYTLTKIYKRSKLENCYFGMQDSNPQLITVLPLIRLHSKASKNIM